MNTKLTKLQRISLLLNLGSLLTSCAVLLSDVLIRNAGSRLGDDPGVIAVTAVVIAALITWAYFLWLRKSQGKIFWFEKNEKNPRHAPRALRMAVLTLTLAGGVALFVVPALLAPRLAPLVWWALIAVCSLVSVFFITIRRSDYLRSSPRQ